MWKNMLIRQNLAVVRFSCFAINDYRRLQRNFVNSKRFCTRQHQHHRLTSFSMWLQVCVPHSTFSFKSTFCRYQYAVCSDEYAAKTHKSCCTIDECDNLNFHTSCCPGKRMHSNDNFFCSQKDVLALLSPCIFLRFEIQLILQL